MSEGVLQQKLLPKDSTQNKNEESKASLTSKQQKVKDEYFKKKHYLFGENLFQTLFFTWISPLLRYGYRIDLDQKSIPYLRQKDLPRIDLNKLQGVFQNKYQRNKSKRQGLTLVRSIFSAFKKQLTTLFILAFVIVSLQMYQPILSHDVIEYIDSSQRTFKTGIIYFIIIFSVTSFLVISQTYMWYYFAVLGYNLSNTLSLIIYNKALKHPMITQKQFQVSQIINFSQVDAQRLTNLGYQMVALLYTPLQIVVGLTLLYIYIGISFLVGLGVMIILMLCTLVFTRIATSSNDQLLKAKDARMKVAEEILQIIKFIKINALEKYFFQKINRKRQAELRLSKKVNLCYVASIFLYWLCPPTIVSFTFLAYVSLGNQISAAKAFFTIIIFNLLQYPIRLLPSAITQLIQIWSSIKRIQKFMKACELNQDCIIQNTSNNQKFALEISKGNFMWGKQKEKDEKKKKQQQEKNKESKPQKKSQKSQSNSSKQTKLNQSMEKISDASITLIASQTISQEQLKQSLLSEGDKSIIQKQNKKEGQNKKQQQKYTKTLHDINIKFPFKQVTMIIGDIGSGKSSLLYAILNQMTPQPQKQSKIIINGSIAYSPQKAWIMTGTVKQNILFFQSYDEERFKNAIYYSCLTDDLKILSKGIDTDIGQKGVNLSGGQKARISLARALYSNKDIYLLDDILSAVDVHVGKFIMEQTILEYLRGKTVIMPTHAVKYLQKADNIIIMKKGRVVQNGPYKHISDTEQFQQIMNLLKKKQQQLNEQKQSKQQQQIVNQLKLVKQATISKQKSLQSNPNNEQQNKKEQVSYTNKIVDQLIMPQDHKKGEVSLQVYKQYVELNGGPLFLIVVIFCMSTWAVLSILSNIQVQQWCEDENKSTYHLYLYLVFAISATVFSGTRAYILVTTGIKQGRTIHKKVMKALLYASITTFYNRVPVGRILNRMSKDLRQIDQSIGYAVGSMLVCFFCMISSLAMCLYASTIFVLIPIIFVGAICRYTLRYYLKSQRQCVRLQNITNSPIVSGFTSTINGVGTIRAYGLSSQFLNHQIDRIDTNKRMKITREALQSWFALRLALLSFFINMSALAYTILSNNQNASLAGLLLTYSSLLNDDIIGFAFTYANMQLRMISIQRVSTFAKLQPQPAYKQYCTKWRTKQQGANLQAIKYGGVEFKNYSARYRQGLPLVINNISLKIQKGQKVGVVGRTGAGKSTLISCLLRILEADSGSIIIDEKNITQYSLKDLRSCITMIEQQPTLMNGTFRDNLDPATMYSDQEIFNILKECNLFQLVQTKGGLSAKVTNDNLSVGEKQLLCICRAFLKKSKIILIDQATANIDVKNDKLIQQVIAIAFKNSTVLTIAHRLTTLQNCDKILVLGQGKILQWGYTKDLLQKPNGIYRKMWEENDNSYLH